MIENIATQQQSILISIWPTVSIILTVGIIILIILFFKKLNFTMKSIESVDKTVEEISKKINRD
ncbi:hypothetical protein RBU61_05395 [Tissierella sp. MB52-C2]|uniref:hypothetical protein n=1 Tax=Tissierella sp. MB52-C2 TaxID=3070999 RepID=UPI00280AD12C|nr:hypothetical protein [Tissierella sp. MB52-C2]WMM26110.1 hypothetical protein RBU61_05395 [Tissierella sp. MB52-C2]